MIADNPTNESQKTLEATRQARSRSPRTSRSLKTGTNAAPSAASATSARTRFGTWKATVNALIEPCTPKKAAATISRSTPATRLSPVAIAKSAVETAIRRRGATSSGAVASVSDIAQG